MEEGSEGGEGIGLNDNLTLAPIGSSKGKKKTNIKDNKRRKENEEGGEVCGSSCFHSPRIKSCFSCNDGFG